jgi:hypothetical protein
VYGHHWVRDGLTYLNYMANEKNKPEVKTEEPEAPKHLSQTHGRLLDAFANLPDASDGLGGRVSRALTRRAAALLASYCICDLGEAPAASLTKEQAHAYADGFYRRHPQLVQAVRVSDICGLVHRLAGRVTGLDERKLQSMVSDLLWEPTSPVVPPGSLTPVLRPG